ncbi:MAG: hypothetical protein VYC34_05540 [Planctomycetota bacterium]|nr:hypothetical protein [Planctomycetota bacterium]
MAGLLRQPVVLIAAGVMLAAAMTGCASDMPQGRTGLNAHYDGMNTVRASLPPTIQVSSALAAAETALRRRGYVITKDLVTEGAGRVVGEEHQRGWLNRLTRRTITVRADVHESGTRVRIMITPTGEEWESREVLEEMLRALAL